MNGSDLAILTTRRLLIALAFTQDLILPNKRVRKEDETVYEQESAEPVLYLT